MDNHDDIDLAVEQIMAAIQKATRAPTSKSTPAELRARMNAYVYQKEIESIEHYFDYDVPSSSQSKEP